MRPLPPLASVRVFEAAARHRNFTKAAEELGMTQAAVSYQVKLLEDRLGTPLFLRLPRNVELTDAGARLAPAVGQALDLLAAAFSAVRDDSQSVLTISSTHTFASNWLAPRLGGFQLAHPDIAVRLDVSGRLVDFLREDIDIGLRIGRGEWPGVRAHLLMPWRYAAFCSPDLLARFGGVETPADLLRLPLISADDPAWARWFAAAGVDTAGLAQRPGLRMDVQQIEGNAAIAGQGVALLMPELWRGEIAAGRLVQPFPIAPTDEGGVWLVYPDHKRNSPKVRAFRDWVLAEAAAAD
jgi:LysR family glycine cleavage system transcriptional activator